MLLVEEPGVPEGNTHVERVVFTTANHIPLLIEKYIAVVERVMSPYGFDPRKCQIGTEDRA